MKKLAELKYRGALLIVLDAFIDEFDLDDEELEMLEYHINKSFLEIALEYYDSYEDFEFTSDSLTEEEQEMLSLEIVGVKITYEDLEESLSFEVYDKIIADMSEILKPRVLH